MNPTPGQFAGVGTLSTLTQPGALTPSSFNDTDVSDATIQIAAGAPVKTPTAVADTLSLAPNITSFSKLMATNGLANGVLGNDTATTNGAMNALLTGSGVTSTVVLPTSSGIVAAAENANVVTVTTNNTISISSATSLGSTVTINTGADQLQCWSASYDPGSRGAFGGHL